MKPSRSRARRCQALILNPTTCHALCLAEDRTQDSCHVCAPGVEKVCPLGPSCPYERLRAIGTISWQGVVEPDGAANGYFVIGPKK